MPSPETRAERALNVPPDKRVPLNGGRNSRLWLIDDGEGPPLVIKQYFDPVRLSREWRALLFMKTAGLTRAPEPLAVDQPQLSVVYGFIPGQAPVKHHGKAEEISPLIDFMAELKSKHPKRRWGVNSSLRVHSKDSPPNLLPAAADAVLDPAGLPEKINFRLLKLKNAAGDYPALNEFLGQLEQAAAERFAAPKITEKLDPGSAILSPSDFGFHNAVKGVDGQVKFIDFEFFGWDDPAKLIVDTLLHPHQHMRLTPAQRGFWLDGMLTLYRDDRILPERVDSLTPLLGLKWALIALNEFNPTGAARRAFADLTIDESQLKIQLALAKNLLKRSESLQSALEKQW